MIASSYTAQTAVSDSTDFTQHFVTTSKTIRRAGQPHATALWASDGGAVSCLWVWPAAAAATNPQATRPPGLLTLTIEWT